MPIFEYACRGCGEQFEALTRASEPAHCPRCDSTDLDKKLSVFATSSSQPEPAFAGGPCGTCGNPAGPGACRVP